MAVKKPKINGIQAFSFLSKEDLIYFGVIPRDFFPIARKSPEKFNEKSVTNDENARMILEPLPEELLRLKKSFSSLLNIKKVVAFNEMDKLRSEILVFFKAKDLIENSPRGVNFARFSIEISNEFYIFF